jgi:hypothetical protein
MRLHQLLRTHLKQATAIPSPSHHFSNKSEFFTGPVHGTDKKRIATRSRQLLGTLRVVAEWYHYQNAVTGRKRSGS